MVSDTDPININKTTIPGYTGEPFGILECESVAAAIKAEDILIKRGHWTARWETRVFMSVNPQ